MRAATIITMHVLNELWTILIIDTRFIRVIIKPKKVKIS